MAAILAGLFTYAWCATFTDRLTAMLAAIIYLTLPYSLTIDLYLRAAIGEFWALSLLPLSFYFIERMAAGSRRAIPGLAVAFALVIVSHLFTAVLLAPVLLVYAVWRVPRGQRVLSACQVFAAFVLATGLAGVYALPFLAQRRFFHPENFLLTQGANASPLSQMFSFNASTFPNTLGAPGWLHLGMAARFIALATAAFIGVVWFRSRGKRPKWLHLVVGVVAIAALLRTALAGYVLSTGEVPGALQLSPYLIEQRAEIFLYSFLTFEAALVCYWSIRNSRHNKLADFLMVLALASYVMMTSWSLVVWRVCALPLEHSVPLALECVATGRDDRSCGARDFWPANGVAPARLSKRAGSPRDMGSGGRTARADGKHRLCLSLKGVVPVPR